MKKRSSLFLRGISVALCSLLMIRVPAGMAAPDTSAGEDPAATYLEAEAQTHERLEGESYDGLVTLIQAGEVPEYVYELMDVPFGQEISYLV